MACGVRPVVGWEDSGGVVVAERMVREARCVGWQAEEVRLAFRVRFRHPR